MIKICWLANVVGGAEGEGITRDNVPVSGLGNQVAGCTTYGNGDSSLIGRQDDKANAALNIWSLSCPQSIQVEVSSRQLDPKCKKSPAWPYRFGSH